MYPAIWVAHTWALQILEREKKIFLENPEIQPDLKWQRLHSGTTTETEARKENRREVTELGVKPTSMIDISDG